MGKLYSAYYQIDNSDQAETFSEQKISIGFSEFDIIKETDKTYTIETKGWNKEKRNYLPRKRIILKDQSGKRFAYTTKERALEAFIIRRKSYGRKLNQAIKNNDRLIEICKNTLIS